MLNENSLNNHIYFKILSEKIYYFIITFIEVKNSNNHTFGFVLIWATKLFLLYSIILHKKFLQVLQHIFSLYTEAQQ